MSFGIDTSFSATLIKAANALDTIDACRNHKLPPSAKKHALLVDTMKNAAARFQALAAQQSAYPADTFFALAYERLSMLRAERAALAKFKREQREARAAELALMQAQLAQEEAIAA